MHHQEGAGATVGDGACHVAAGTEPPFHRPVTLAAETTAPAMTGSHSPRAGICRESIAPADGRDALV